MNFPKYLEELKVNEKSMTQSPNAVKLMSTVKARKIYRQDNIVKKAGLIEKKVDQPDNRIKMVVGRIDGKERKAKSKPTTQLKSNFGNKNIQHRKFELKISRECDGGSKVDGNRGSQSLISRTHSQLSQLMEFSDSPQKKIPQIKSIENADDYVTLQDSDEFMVQGGSNMFGIENDTSTAMVNAETEEQLRVNTHSTNS